MQNKLYTFNANDFDYVDRRSIIKFLICATLLIVAACIPAAAVMVHTLSFSYEHGIFITKVSLTCILLLLIWLAPRLLATVAIGKLGVYHSSLGLFPWKAITTRCTVDLSRKHCLEAYRYPPLLARGASRPLVLFVIDKAIIEREGYTQTRAASILPAFLKWKTIELPIPVGQREVKRKAFIKAYNICLKDRCGGYALPDITSAWKLWSIIPMTITLMFALAGLTVKYQRSLTPYPPKRLSDNSSNYSVLKEWRESQQEP